MVWLVHAGGTSPSYALGNMSEEFLVLWDICAFLCSHMNVSLNIVMLECVTNIATYTLLNLKLISRFVLYISISVFLSNGWDHPILIDDIRIHFQILNCSCQKNAK